MKISLAGEENEIYVTTDKAKDEKAEALKAKKSKLNLRVGVLAAPLELANFSSTNPPAADSFSGLVICLLRRLGDTSLCRPSRRVLRLKLHPPTTLLAHAETHDIVSSGVGRAQVVPNTIHHQPTTGNIRVGQEQHELIAAKPAADIILSELALEKFRDHCSAWSPARWPCKSLIFLRSSRSSPAAVSFKRPQARWSLPGRKVKVAPVSKRGQGSQ